MGSRTIRSGVVWSGQRSRWRRISQKQPEAVEPRKLELSRETKVSGIQLYFHFFLSLPPVSYSRDVTKLRRRRRRQQESLKPNGFYEQNWTTLHVRHAFFVHFFPIPDRLYIYHVKLPNCKLTWERERLGDKFYYLSLNSDVVPSL